jgi:UDP-N-acetylmuramoylalanine--D-glutamate ligase
VKNALVLGIGVSGYGAARLLLENGYGVTAVDCSQSEDVCRRAASLRAAGASVEQPAGGLPAGQFDLCVLSPGVPLDGDWVKEVSARAIEVLPELEVGWKYSENRMMAITGTNGKSTVTKLCGACLTDAGMSVEVGGNYGTPVSEIVRSGRETDWIVAEVSSFQLEPIKEFRPRVGVLLNLQPDHLDRHGDMASYEAAKMRIFKNMKSGDTAVVLDKLADAARTSSQGDNGWLTFGISESADFRYCDGYVVSGAARGNQRINLKGSKFESPIGGVNAAAVAAALYGAGADLTVIEGTAREFVTLPHRMETVAEIGGVTFIDDSKATNLGAMNAALRGCEKPVRLIAGGLLKEKNIESAKELLANKVRRVYLIGKAAREMGVAWNDAVDCVDCGTLGEATKLAWNDAEAGDAILLSPGCASFDQFAGFAERGRQFTAIAGLIKTGE